MLSITLYTTETVFFFKEDHDYRIIRAYKIFKYTYFIPNKITFKLYVLCVHFSLFFAKLHKCFVFFFFANALHIHNIIRFNLKNKK